MSFKTSAALIGAFAAASVMAHGTVTGIRVDGEYQGGFKLDYYYAKANGQEMPETVGWYAENLDNGFVDGTGYQTADINCHKNSEPAPITTTVAAGGKVDFLWSAWPESHFGPVFTYVAKCAGECSAADKTALKWVKIDEAGYDVSAKSWAATDLIANNNTWTTTVPETLAPGNYVFRHEIIAMHGAGSENGAQNYPQCFNIKITGSGTDEPEGTLGTALYKSDDAGILFNPYAEITSYEIPGPALYGSGSSASPPASGSDSEETTPVPSVPPATPIAAPPAESSPSPVVSSATFQSTFVARPNFSTLSTAVVAAPTAAAAPTATSAPSDDSSEALPETFTLDTFIDWLKSAAGSRNTRRHARALKH